MQNQRFIQSMKLTLGWILIFLWSCATPEVYDSWKGAPVSELIAVWGFPKEKKILKSGSAVYIYNRIPGETKTSYLGNYTGPTKLTAFFIDKNGIIYNWKQKTVAQTLLK